MEDVLKVYARPYNEQHPVVCMDEASRQLLADLRSSFVDSHGATHIDYEYVRHGEQSIFLATEPLARWRTAKVTNYRRAIDWARFVKEDIIDRYPKARKIVLVMDNLNTHKLASFYEAYPPEQASALCDRLEIHHTPKHGSWLDIAEIELSALQNQCLGDRRIPTKEKLQQEVTSWASTRNQAQRGVKWQFTAKDARTKLLRLYPTIELATQPTC